MALCPDGHVLPFVFVILLSEVQVAVSTVETGELEKTELERRKCEKQRGGICLSNEILRQCLKCLRSS